MASLHITGHLIIGNMRGGTRREWVRTYATTSTVATLLNGVSSMEMLSVEHVKKEEQLRIFDTKPTESRAGDSDMNRLRRGDRPAQKPRAGSGQQSGAAPQHWPLPLYSRLLGSRADVRPILAKKNAHFAWSNFRLSSAVCGLPLAPLRPQIIPL